MILHQKGDKNIPSSIYSHIILPDNPLYAALTDFTDYCHELYSFDFGKINYDFSSLNNVHLNLWILTTKQYLNLVKNHPVKLFLGSIVELHDPLHCELIQLFHSCLKKYKLSHMIFQEMRFMFDDFEGTQKAEIISATQRKSWLALHVGYSMFKVAKTKYKFVDSYIKINEEETLYIFGIMYDDRKELEKALASGILQNIKKLILKNLTELDTEYHYFTPENTRVAVFDQSQVLPYDYRDSIVEFKNLDDIIIL